MKDETKIWIKYSTENLDSANILLKSKLFNPCLQNVQQAVEKILKSVFIENDLPLKRTHDILELKNLLKVQNIKIDILDEDCDFLNTIYLPSKYPLGSVIPDYEPDNSICSKAIAIADKVTLSVSALLKKQHQKK